MVEKSKYDSYVNGNVLVVPEEEQKQQRKVKKRYKRKVEVLWKKQYLRTVGIIFAVGLALMINEVGIYKNQNELTSIQSHIDNVDNENNAMRINKLKSESYSTIETKAEAMGMVSMEKGTAMQYKNLNTDYFSSYQPTVQKDTVFTFIMKFIK